MIKTAITVSCIAGVMFGVSPRVAAAPEIWGDTIMKQPFDKAPYREIKVPDWVSDLNTVCYGVPPYASKEFATMVKDGMQTACVFFADPINACYDSQYLKKRNLSYTEELLRKDYDAFNKAGLKIIGVIPPALIGEVYFDHPEYRRIAKNTTDIPNVDPVKEPYGGPLCITGPWGDEAIKILEEITAKYPKVTAWSFDGIHDYGCCYCKSCRDDYRKDTGLEIPDSNMEDTKFRHYLQWLDRRMESFVIRLQTRLKSINPDIALITWTTNAGRFGHFMSIPRNMPTRLNLLFDCPDQEFWMDETNRGNSVVSAFANAYMWAVTNHREAMSSPYMMSHGNPYDDSSFPKEEYLRRVLLAYTYGPRVSTYPTKSVMTRSPWLSHKKPEPWAAMVMSDNTNCFYGRDPKKVEERYLADVLGVFRTSIEEHLPMTVINDWNLNSKDLADYKVLVLPNTAVMNEEQAAAIRSFVKNGGGLVASVDTSLCNEFSDQREDFLLADLFGVHYKGVAVGSSFMEDLDVNFLKGIDENYWEKRRSIFDFRSTDHPLFDTPLLKEYMAKRSVVFKGPAALVAADTDVPVVGTMITRELGAKPIPSIVARTYGKGKVVYLAAGFDAGYYLYPYPYQRHLIAQAIRWVAPEQPKIKVIAPMCVHSTFYRQQKDGQRLVVHLYNDLNSAGNHAKPDDDVPLREEVVPIHDIKVTFKGYSITKVHLEPEGKTLQMKKTADGIQVTVPKLLIHSMVVAELQ
ncbi:MAG: ThuA domain-containing protein [Armatimonadota bacterium]